MKMTTRLALALLPALALAACATPQQRCINSVTRDLRVVTDLIAQTEINLARGYGTVEQTVFVPTMGSCGGAWPVQRADGTTDVVWVPQMCWQDQAVTVERAVAIDLAAERRKLQELRQQQARLNKLAAPAVEQCRATYPS
jgi:hypothetical protein